MKHERRDQSLPALGTEGTKTQTRLGDIRTDEARLGDNRQGTLASGTQALPF